MQANQFCTVLLMSLFLSAAASAQVFDSGPSNPALFDNVFNVPGDVLPNVFDIPFEETTQVNVASGGIVGDVFTLFDNSEVNISGGIVGLGLGVFGNSEVNISGGFVGESFSASGEVNISGGTVGEGFSLCDNSIVNISGGTVGLGFTVSDNNVVNISGGSVGELFSTSGEVNISGGSFGDDFTAFSGSSVNLFGSDFVLDGVPLDNLIQGEAFTIFDRDVTLSGLFADGSAFSFDLNSELKDFQDTFESGSTLTVTLGPPPITGDFNADGDVDCDDLDGYVDNLEMAASGALAALDFDGDGLLSQTDADLVITTLVVTSNGEAGTFRGDFNCDGAVDVLGDAFALVGNLGNSVTSYSQGDANFDGTVDVLGDAFILIGNLGQSNEP